MNKKILHEIQKQIEQRGGVTKEQRDYARVELEQMEKMYPLTSPWEEKRLSHLRTLDSYIGNQILRQYQRTKNFSFDIFKIRSQNV